MNINTKFNVGDMVYIISNRLELPKNKYCISMIKIIVDPKNNVNVLYTIDDDLFTDKQIFTTFVPF